MTLVRLTLIFQIVSSIFSATSFAGSFVSGNDFDTTVLNGSIQVQCYSGSSLQKVVNFTCRRSILDPVEIDYMLGSVGVNADQIAISSELETGEVRNRVVAYDSKLQRTADKINLWLAGLIQRPILGIGQNKISYNMTKNGVSVSKGSFVATVSKNPPINCAFSTVISYNSDDCDSQFTMCDRYFQDNHNCR